MNITFKGQFKASAPEKQLSNGKTTQKFYLDIDTDTQYPTVCEIEVYNKKMGISKLKPGDTVTVETNFSGLKWENPEGKKYFFQKFSAWKITTEAKVPELQIDEQTEPEPITGNDGLPF